MTRPSFRRTVVVGVAALFLGLALAAVALSDTTFTDPAGDSPNAPDITSIAVSNDAAGIITFVATLAGPLGGDSIFLLDLDTDANPSTGGFGGEYEIVAGLGGFGLAKWDGAKFTATTAASLSSTISGNTITIRIGRSDIGNITRLGFGSATVRFDAADKYVGEDDAPDGGEYQYTLTFPQCSNGKDDDGDGKVDGQDLGCSSPTDDLESDDPVTLKIGKAIAIPAKPKAGKGVLVGVPVIRVETGQPVTSGTARCATKVGTKSIRSAGGAVGKGVAVCSFKLPATSAGKLLKGTITVTVLGHSKVAAFAFRIS